ncbi:MAG: DEAD/DEAH box helicase, partial [Myxococcales bacterium]|nr:DEAD/DEAH box helicase [Myxococcales bacterium]
ADDMGLGKTVQTLATLIDTHREPGPPSLVVAPTSVLGEWAAQAARFAPTLTVHVHHGGRRGEIPADADLVITTYALLRLDQETLARPWRYVVLDEAQTIKNPASAVTRAARGLDARHRLALTGTPLENHLLELWSLFHWLMPGFFGSQGAFGQRYLRPIQDDESEAAMEALRARIRPFILRRLKREVAAELPPRQVQVLRCELTEPERALYEKVKHTFRDQVLGKVRRDGVKRSTIQVLEALMRLRQAACDAGLLPFPEAQGLGPSSKRLLLLDLVGELVEEGHRALVFSQWPSLLKRVAEDLDAHGVPYLYLDGSTTNRAALVERFNRPDGPPLFLISLKAGGTGLNLTAADHVVHLDPWWNPAAEDQATDRAHRIGQTRPVMVYRLVAAETVEEKVLELQARKRALASAAIDAERVFVDDLRAEDLEAVFGAEAEPFDAPPEVPAGPPGLPPALGAVLEGRGRLTTALVREVLRLPDDRAARQQLALWVELGVLRREGRGRATHYVAARAGDAP